MSHTLWNIRKPQNSTDFECPKPCETFKIRIFDAVKFKVKEGWTEGEGMSLEFAR